MKIVNVPNTVLTSPAQVVNAFDAKLKKLVSDMSAVLVATKNPKGVGLAAPQIGISQRVFIIKPTPKAPIDVFINPEIMHLEETTPIDQKKSVDNRLEGCLSIPRIWGNVKRSWKILVKYQDIEGNVHKQEYSGFPATIIQHETDHLNGILFTQRVLEQGEKFYQSTLDANGKEALDEMKI